MSNINTKWISNLTADQKKEMESSVRGSSIVLSRLRDIILKELESQEYNSSSEQYNKPNWAFEQAHRNGKVAVLKDVLRLTDHLKGTK